MSECLLSRTCEPEKEAQGLGGQRLDGRSQVGGTLCGKDLKSELALKADL